MYQRLVKIFVIVTLFSAVLTAGQTGKITGTVVDQETGNPLPGVNVLLEGTSMGAATNSDGKFVILDIPPGLYLVKFSFIGYATITIENVRSTTDLTTNLYTINMNPEAIEGETITVTAERPLIEINATNEVHVIRAEDIKNLPVRGYANVVALQTSVVDDGGTLHIRGGRSEEVGYYVDGVSAVDPYSLTRRGSIPNISIEEVSVQAGGFGAEYGGAGSGIVNTTTKTGGGRLAVTGEFISDIGTTEPSTDRDELYSYGYNLMSLGVGGPIPVMDFIKFYGALESIRQDDSPTAGSFPVYNKDLNIANGRPENGDPFTDLNGNTIWDAGESYTDTDGDGAYTAPSYLRIVDDDIDFVYGPRADNWYNRLNANWNLLVDLSAFLPFAWRLKVGGTYFDSHSSNYSHYRSLFSFYNDASTMDGTSSAGSLKHRYSQSESTINNQYLRLSGAVPGLDQMFFTVQYSHGKINDDSYDPVTKDGWGHFVYEDGTVSDIEVPYIQGGKWYDLSGTPTWVYENTAGETVTKNYWDYSDDLTFVQINYDTTYINPLNRATGSGPVPYVEIANYGVAGLNSGYSGIYKAEKLRDEFKTNLLWQLGDHEIKIGGSYEKGQIKRYSVSGSWAAMYFNSNEPYSEGGDRWTWDPDYNDGAGALVTGGDGIADYKQDPSDTYNGDKYKGYWDDYLYQAYKSAYANNVGYDVTGVGLAEMQDINKARTPITVAAYFQDKFELDDLILNVGLRWDHIDPANKVFNPLTGGNRNIVIDSEGYLAETVYWNDVDGDGIKGPREYTSALPTDDDSQGLSHQVDVTPSAQLSPRIGLGFPITDRTAFHATYGKYLQAARWDNLYISWNRFLSNIQQGNYTRSANPELQPTKTTEYEIGFKQLVTDDISIDMTLFYTEKKDFIQIRNVAASPTGYALYSNGDFSTVKGLAFALRTRRLGNTKVDANYTMSYSGGTGSNADTGYRISWLGGNDPTFTSPLTFDQRHT
ncbi:MAG TPA: TonB-dependent receptor, partial [Candidatus Marinimicrobia bacterium]|nr:TonB-dependent receptor [Candidatus Neomarinimicrobiota bacterium]